MLKSVWILWMKVSVARLIIIKPKIKKTMKYWVWFSFQMQSSSWIKAQGYRKKPGEKQLTSLVIWCALRQWTDWLDVEKWENSSCSYSNKFRLRKLMCGKLQQVLLLLSKGKRSDWYLEDIGRNELFLLNLYLPFK